MARAQAALDSVRLRIRAASCPRKLKPPPRCALAKDASSMSASYDPGAARNHAALRAASPSSARFVAAKGHAVHDAAIAVVIVDRVVLRATVVPECDRADFPAEAAGEFRTLLVGEQILQ